jgi:hypothetical protein
VKDYVKLGDVLAARGDQAGALASYRAGVAAAEQYSAGLDWQKVFDPLPISYKPTETYDPAELRRMAEESKKGFPPNSEGSKRRGRLFDLFARACAEKDGYFRYLLDRKDLPEVSRALYDYAINGNSQALDLVLATLAGQEVGSDSGVAGILGYIDEWDRTPAAVESHFTASDGAGGITHGAFWMTRRYLFPRNYLKYKNQAGEGAPGLNLR